MDNLWINGGLFFLGFFHGLRVDHLVEVLHSKNASTIYQSPSIISFKLGFIHIIYILFWIIPLIILKQNVVTLSHFPNFRILGILFFILAIYSLYEFFILPPKGLHQHEHPHKHEHGHQHTIPNLNGKKEHTGHLHQCPQLIDKPGPAASNHTHTHHHHHEHLHFHQFNKKLGHIHFHHSSIFKSLKTPSNLLLLLTLSFLGMVFPVKKILCFLSAFFIGLFCSIYLLEILYRGKGINLMEKMANYSNFFIGTIGAYLGYFLFFIF